MTLDSLKFPVSEGLSEGVSAVPEAGSQLGSLHKHHHDYDQAEEADEVEDPGHGAPAGVGWKIAGKAGKISVVTNNLNTIKGVQNSVVKYVREGSLIN